MKGSILALAATLGALALILPLGVGAQVPAPTCNGQTATIYVGANGRIVGGPQNGRPYRGELNGTARNDVIVGTNGPDEISARGGSDVVCALGGNDEIEAGAGNDTMSGGPGADEFKGGAGTDTATDFNQAEGDTKRGVEQTTPTPSGADISLAITGPAPNIPGGVTVRVSNAGPNAATVQVLLECGPSTAGAALSSEPNPGDWNLSSGPPGDLNATSTSPIPSGGSRTVQAGCFGNAGYLEVASSSQSDPDSTPNNAVATEDDYVVIPAPPVVAGTLNCVTPTTDTQNPPGDTADNSDNQFDFGYVYNTQTPQVTATCTAGGPAGAGVTISSISLSGNLRFPPDDNDGFSIASSTCTVGTELQSGENCTIIVDFHSTVATDADFYTATLSVNHDGTNGPTDHTFFEGSGLGTPIE